MAWCKRTALALAFTPNFCVDTRAPFFHHTNLFSTQRHDTTFLHKCHRLHQWCMPPWLTSRLSAPQLMFIAYFSANCMSKDMQSPSKMEER